MIVQMHRAYSYRRYELVMTVESAHRRHERSSKTIGIAGKKNASHGMGVDTD
jgi:hypothetical protein